MVPMLVSRHPLIVLEMLAIVLAVRLVWADRLVQGWSWLIRVAAVFVDIDDEMGRREFAHDVDADVLGAADFRHRLEAGARVDAEAGAAHEAIGEPQITDEFGQ